MIFANLLTLFHEVVIVVLGCQSPKSGYFILSAKTTSASK